MGKLFNCAANNFPVLLGYRSLGVAFNFFSNSYTIYSEKNCTNPGRKTEGDQNPDFCFL